MDPAVAEAFRTQPRARFLPASARDRATQDVPIQIGAGQTCSQPRTVAAMLDLLQVHPGQRVLDVGSGSGWTTALLAELTGPEGSVVGVEIEPSLVTVGSANLARAGVPWASIRPAAAGVLGVPEDAPYDRILVSANARRLPDELVDQLAENGRLVVPVDGWLTLVVKESWMVRATRHGPYRFVPLR